MKRSVILVVAASALLVGLSFFFACEGGEYEVVRSTGGPSASGAAGTLQGFVRDFQTKTDVQNAFVEVLNDVTGELMNDPATGEPISAISSSDGDVSFILPAGVEKVAIRVSKEGSTDTVQFHFDVGMEGEEFLLVSNATKDFIALGLGVTLDAAKGVAAGGVYWGNPVDEFAVGCAQVNFSPDDGQNVYYFGPDALPTAARNVSQDSPANGQGTFPGYDTKDQAISYYVSLNKDVNYFGGTGSTINAQTKANDADDDDDTSDDDADDDDGVAKDAGPLWITARIYDTESTGTISQSVESSGITPRIYPNTVTIANVYFTFGEFAENPTASWCTQ